MRPVFKLPVPGDGRGVFDKLSEKLATENTKLMGQVMAPNAYLRRSDEHSRLLSPHLNLQLREDGDRTLLYGRFSPRPNVWTGFMALFFFIAMLGLTGLVYGLAQLTLGGSIWAVWAAPASLVLNAFIYGAAFIGQGLSGGEMYELRAFVEAAIRETEQG
jgi:hypothetical protein